MDKAKITFYGHPESGHCYKVKLLLTFAKIDHEYEIVDIFIDRNSRPEPFRSLSLSHFGEVPLLVSDGRALAQSNAILIYLARKYRIFGGDDPGRLERAQEWLFWEANKIGLSLPQLRLARNYFPTDYPRGSIKWLQGRYDADSGRLEQELADGRRFILGDSLTIADISLCAYMFWVNQAHVRPLPKTCAWLGRIAAMPGWRSPYQLLDPSATYQTFGAVKEEFLP